MSLSIFDNKILSECRSGHNMCDQWVFTNVRALRFLKWCICIYVIFFQSTVTELVGLLWHNLNSLAQRYCLWYRKRLSLFLYLTEIIFKHHSFLYRTDISRVDLLQTDKHVCDSTQPVAVLRVHMEAISHVIAFDILEYYKCLIFMSTSRSICLLLKYHDVNPYFTWGFGATNISENFLLLEISWSQSKRSTNPDSSTSIHVNHSLLWSRLIGIPNFFAFC